MSFRLFVYYSAICGAAAGLLAWAIGGVVPGGSVLLAAALHGLMNGLCIALALGAVDVAAQLSLRQRALTGQRLVAVGLLGAAGGFLGGLFALSGFFVSLVLGSGLTGLLIGASSGLFDWLLCAATGQDTRGPRRKALLGMMGGAAGAIAGSLLALIFAGILNSLFAAKGAARLWSPLAWTIALYGAAIPTGVSLVQVLLRRNWLDFEQGCRAGCEVLLSRPLLTLGRSDQCDVGLQGDARTEMIHARLEQHGKRFLVLDAGSQSGTFVNGQRLDGPHILQPGDQIQIGDTVLRFLEKG